MSVWGTARNAVDSQQHRPKRGSKSHDQLRLRLYTVQSWSSNYSPRRQGLLVTKSRYQVSVRGIGWCSSLSPYGTSVHSRSLYTSTHLLERITGAHLTPISRDKFDKTAIGRAPRIRNSHMTSLSRIDITQNSSRR
jgi:hypothetical protein